MVCSFFLLYTQSWMECSKKTWDFLNNTKMYIIQFWLTLPLLTAGISELIFPVFQAIHWN